MRSCSNLVSRRGFMKVGGLALAGLGAGILLPDVRANSVAEIGMKSDAAGSRVWFDPIGILVQPGTTIRWRLDSNVHTATAYHPDNSNRSLRIPEGAPAWDSGFLVKPGSTFEVTLNVEGVYDYFCLPHEMAGMVGRIIVGRPAGPGMLPFDYFSGDPAKAGWAPVPEAAQSAFPSIEKIMSEGVVHFA